MSSQFTNPPIYEDLPDAEVIRVGDVYFMSASSFHCSPGAPVLESRDLVNWEYVGHSVPELPPRDRFSLDGRRPTAYNKGIWASTLRYRDSNGLFYFYSPIQGTDETYIWTAKSPGDIWTAHPPIERFYYDLGLLIDDEDTMYIAHGTKTIEVAQLSPDGFREVANKVVYTSEAYVEGARMYKIKGAYYIWLTKDWDAQCVLKSVDGPFGPYEARDVIKSIRSPIPGAAAPHQGGLVDTPDGKWYYMAFVDAFPTGRVPVLAPINFDDEGWPSVEADYSSTHNGQWRAQYPHISPDGPKGRPWTAKRLEFKDNGLDPCWEWNHNPDNSKWRVEAAQLILQTGTITQSLHLATNTLTHRTVGPGSIITFSLDVSRMKNGDRAGLSMFRDESAYIGIHRHAEGASLAYVNGIKVGPIKQSVGFMNGRPAALDWEIISDGSVQREVPLQGDLVWLRIKADCRAAQEGDLAQVATKAVFEYRHQRTAFTQLGPAYELSKLTAGFMGYRFGLFNFATRELGGEIRANYCDFEIWHPID